MSVLGRRWLSSSGVAMARSKPLKFSDLKSIKLRDPIVPLYKNFDVNQNHPLYQFFGNPGAALRSAGELDSESREWTFAELRRKSFDDLHTLWYLLLKQRNILATEVRLGQSLNYRKTQAHDELDDKLKLSQKRIKQVLLERQVAYERAQTMTQEKAQYLDDFRTRYISAAADEVVAMNEKLVRLQYAFFGIQPHLSEYDLDGDINETFVDGLAYIADLKSTRYVEHNPESQLSLPLNGVMEHLPFLLKSVDEAVTDVVQLRESGQSVVLNKIDVLPFLRSALQSVIESEPKE